MTDTKQHIYTCSSCLDLLGGRNTTIIMTETKQTALVHAISCT